MSKNQEYVLRKYLEIVEEDMAFPVQFRLQKEIGNPNNTRYHLGQLQKVGVLTRNDNKQFIPGPNFIVEMTKLGLLDKWLQTEAGPLLLSQLGGVSRNRAYTKVGVITDVDEDGAVVTWLEDDGPGEKSRLSRRVLRRVWPVHLGNKLYATRLDSKLNNFAKEER